MTRKAVLAIALMLACALPALAQKITVTGTVYEPEGEPALGASVTVQGHTMGVVTDLDGVYSIQVGPNESLVFSYIGCDTQVIPVQGRTHIDVTLTTNTTTLQEVVAIGYGTVKKSDATGSVGIVKPNEIEAGLASSAQDLLVGSSPGVVVQTDGGSPQGGAKIQIRGGASLTATTEPLIVIDGVPMDSKGVTGSSNPLALVNPENIESMTILKDASATAIFGSRASNGVIIITTKKGQSGRPQVNFSANFYVNTPRNYLNMMSGNEFADFIMANYEPTSASVSALGLNGEIYNTDWQKEVLRTSFSHDYSVSVGGTAGILPYRFAVGYTDNQGIIRGSGMKRLTGSINLTPKFFDDLLSVNANLKGAYIRNNYDQGPLGAAVSFNPTLPVKTPYNTAFNNWTTYTNGGSVAGEKTPGTDINTLQAVNPVSLIEDYYSKSNVYQSVGNLQLDLKMPFLRELSVNLNLGYDYSHGECASLNSHNSPNAWLGGFSGYVNAAGQKVLPGTPEAATAEIINFKEGYGNRSKSLAENLSLLLDLLVNYNKEFKEIQSNLAVTGGYSWQHFNQKGHNFSTVDSSIAYADDEALRQWAGYQYSPTYYWEQAYQLVSFFGRVNYTFMDKYLLTATLRHDGTSRFGKEHRWGTYPAVALGWKILDENFMENTRSWLNELKLRGGYGVTGQQGLNDNYFPYLAKYYNNLSNMTNRYPINGDWVHPLTPDKYNADLKWESTATWNVGLDFGFLNNRVNGSIEFYLRKTTDLLVDANYPAGSNFSNVGTINAGDLQNKGFEININTKPVVLQDFRWSSNINLAYNKNKITRIAEGYNGITGGIGNGVNVEKHEVGHPAYSFYVYEQVYDNAGNPIEGVYVDQNGDGIITDADKIMYHSIFPAWTGTWTNTLNYKNWDFGIVLRGSFDNWAYNKNQANNSFINPTTTTSPLSNLMADTYLFTQARSTEQLTSNYFVQNASFVRCDNITLGYTWDNLLKEKLRLRVFGAVQNPFVITKYKGLDPEVSYNNGIDNSVYPRPITFSLGLVASF